MSPSVSRPEKSQYRWVICALLFFATVIAYIDRGILGYMRVDLARIIPWNEAQYANIAATFKYGYCVGLLVAGWFTDRLGTRIGFAIAIVLWSLAAMSPGLATSALTFGIAMFFLGLGEAANFPACIKTVAEWFPRKERALATSVFNSGANIGAMLVPVVVPLLVALFTPSLKGDAWRGSFAATGAVGFLWLFFWLTIYRRPEEHKKVSAAELAYIQSDAVEPVARMPYAKLFPKVETWAFGLAKFLTDGVWWFYSFWLPGYWQRTFNLGMEGTRLPVIVAFAVSIVGGLYGGYLSGALLKRGKAVGTARKTALLVCASAILPVVLVPFIHNLWGQVAVVCLAMAAHQGWSANLFTVPSDLFPKAAVASVVGIGGAMGAIGGALLDKTVGWIVTATHTYVLVFALCGSLYFVALLVLHLMKPQFTPAKLD